MYFEVIGEIEGIEAIAIGTSIRDIARLRKRYGTGRWRKLKGMATVRLRRKNKRKGGPLLALKYTLQARLDGFHGLSIAHRIPGGSLPQGERVVSRLYTAGS